MSAVHMPKKNKKSDKKDLTEKLLGHTDLHDLSDLPELEEAHAGHGIGRAHDRSTAGHGHTHAHEHSHSAKEPVRKVAEGAPKQLGRM